ncbi:hypothetical protein EOD39_22050 [Acipenser ruthenus]|uniref:Transmembrane protein 100 n=1 Tax=Acipenser ruthenus TaxID=7906 RepID=A0A444UR10_ACIRT|nr:hypothetical protein EOD39_22050 [Acipenser ruthenus]
MTKQEAAAHFDSRQEVVTLGGVASSWTGIAVVTGGTESSWGACLLAFGMFSIVIGACATGVGLWSQSQSRDVQGGGPDVLLALGLAVLGAGLLSVMAICLWRRFRGKRQEKNREGRSMLVRETEEKKYTV